MQAKKIMESYNRRLEYYKNLEKESLAAAGAVDDTSNDTSNDTSSTPTTSSSSKKEIQHQPNINKI